MDRYDSRYGSVALVAVYIDCSFMPTIPFQVSFVCEVSLGLADLTAGAHFFLPHYAYNSSVSASYLDHGISLLTMRYRATPSIPDGMLKYSRDLTYLLFCRWWFFKSIWGLKRYQTWDVFGVLWNQYWWFLKNVLEILWFSCGVLLFIHMESTVQYVFPVTVCFLQWSISPNWNKHTSMPRHRTYIEGCRLRTSCNINASADFATARKIFETEIRYCGMAQRNPSILFGITTSCVRK